MQLIGANSQAAARASLRQLEGGVSGFVRQVSDRLKDVLALLESARSYDADKVFARGQILWKAALDEIVNPCYLAADEETRKKIGTWRIALDSQLNAERPFLELVYPANSAAAEEILMNLYRTGALEESMNAN